jgi:hypothetical protein
MTTPKLDGSGLGLAAGENLEFTGLRDVIQSSFCSFKLSRVEILLFLGNWGKLAVELVDDGTCGVAFVGSFVVFFVRRFPNSEIKSKGQGNLGVSGRRRREAGRVFSTGKTFSWLKIQSRASSTQGRSVRR